jgi:hypothetical protein
MPMGEGFWIHSRSGRWEPVYEHLDAILEDPSTYGLSEIQVRMKRGESAEDRRERVLVAAMKKGWIRARSHRGYTVFEYWTLNRRIADAIFDFIVEVLGAGPAASYQLNEIRSGRGFSVNARDFYDQVEAQLAGACADPEDAGGETLYLLGCAMGQGRCADHHPEG